MASSRARPCAQTFCDGKAQQVFVWRLACKGHASAQASDMSDDIVREFLVESHENLDLLDRELVLLEKIHRTRHVVQRVFAPSTR